MRVGALGNRLPLFTRTGRDRLKDEDDNKSRIQIPDGWNDDYWLGRPVWTGYCRWSELIDGTLTLEDLMDMHRSMNLKDYLAQQANKTENKE